MSVLVVGLSHRSAPVDLLERTALGEDGIAKLLADAAAAEHVDETLVLATCNRLELYADVRKFHGGVQELTELVVEHTGVPLDDLTAHLYVHYEDRAVQHLFAVAAGLESMVVGEQQILGQIRTALQFAREEGTVGRALGPFAESALRAGKRVHAETGIDRAGRSLVTVGIGLARDRLGSLDTRRALLVGAGSMGSLAGATLQNAGIGEVRVANRTTTRAQRLAESLGGAAIELEDLADEIAAADLVVTCTGAVGTVVSAAHVELAMRDRADRPLFVLDLALPRDVDPVVRDMPGVALVDLDDLRLEVEDAEIARDVESARRIVTEEVASFLTKQRSERVAPTVAALRARAQEVVDAEMQRFAGRVPELDKRTATEVATTVARVVDKLLHAPTVRVKELAGLENGESYAEVLRELFALDPSATEAVARADVVVEDGG